MVKHLAFFDALSAEEIEESTDQTLIVIGYFVIRCFDDWTARGPALFAFDGGAKRIFAMLEDRQLGTSPYTPVFRDILAALKSAPDWNASSVVSPFLTYAGLLEADSRWALAADVYGTVADALSENESLGSPDVTSAGFARRKQAFTLRHIGDFDGAQRAYHQAILGAVRAGDTLTAHYAKLGLVNVKRIKGNLPDARDALNTLLIEAQTHPHETVSHAVSDILNARGAVNHELGDYDQAILDFYDAYQHSENTDTQNQCLTDLAACAIRKGYYTFAYHALQLVLHRCTIPHRRQFAILNLMSLAIAQGDPVAFRAWSAQWEPAISDTAQDATARLLIAQGLEQFGTLADAKHAYEDAAAFAAQERIHKVQFDALERLKKLSGDGPVGTPQHHAITPATLPVSLTRAADAIASEHELLVKQSGY